MGHLSRSFSETAAKDAFQQQQYTKDCVAWQLLPVCKVGLIQVELLRLRNQSKEVA
ncbi:hypothetical protein RCCS2_16626 [Roseobacter sp. CCS2]|nr:hypothetical protein RCCS2_16626 [Roseobacter sp. CCS2]